MKMVFGTNSPFVSVPFLLQRFIERTHLYIQLEKILELVAISGPWHRIQTILLWNLLWSLARNQLVAPILCIIATRKSSIGNLRPIPGTSGFFDLVKWIFSKQNHSKSTMSHRYWDSMMLVCLINMKLPNDQWHFTNSLNHPVEHLYVCMLSQKSGSSKRLLFDLTLYSLSFKPKEESGSLRPMTTWSNSPFVCSMKETPQAFIVCFSISDRMNEQRKSSEIQLT